VYIIPLLHFTVFLVDIGLIALLLYKNPRATLNRVCALLIISFAIWSFGYCGMNLSHSPETAWLWLKIGGTGWCIFPAAALYFFLSLNQRILFKNKVLLSIVLILTGFFLFQLWEGNLIVKIIHHQYWWYGGWSPGVYSYLFFSYYFSVSLYCIYRTFNYGRKAQTIREETQARILLYTAIISLVLASIMNVILPVTGLNILPQIADIIIVIWEIGIILSIIKFGLMTITPAAASDQIISTMTDSLMLLDMNGTIKLVNGATHELLATHDVELNGTNFVSFVVEKESAQLLLEDARINGKSINQELTYVSRDNKKIHVQVSVSTILDQMKTTLGFVVVAHDITERKRMEDRILNLYEKEKSQRLELQEEAKARGLFIDVLAHELRTPLTPILASTSMLKERVEAHPDEILKRISENIYFSARNLSAKLEDLLDLARYSRGTFKLNIQPVDFNCFLEDVIYRFRPSLDRLNQQLIVTAPDKLPIVEIDMSRLEQVITNLISNASKYGPDQSRILLNIKTDDYGIIVEVQDFGIGISQEDQLKLFQPYHRVQQDRQRFPGIGLGLAVCKQIIEAHKGKIWVTSQTGQGSTFSFHIPISAKKCDAGAN
jgi:PAS domain S-box-containing protein